MLQELTQRVRESNDGLVVVMPVGGWIDARLWRSVDLDRFDPPETDTLADGAPIQLRDRVRVPDGRTGEVIGFYPEEHDLVLVLFISGTRQRYLRAELRLAS